MDLALSDHYAICWKVFLPKPLLEKKDIIYRSLNRIDLSSFRKNMKNLNLIDTDIASQNDLVEGYNMKLGSLLDDHAPAKSKIVTLCPKSPWFTLEIQEQKVKRRRMERCLRKTRLTRGHIRPIPWPIPMFYLRNARMKLNHLCQVSFFCKRFVLSK